MKFQRSVAFDLDGTLAQDDGWKGPTHFGKPVPAMVDTVKQHLKDGDTVKIFTARAVDPNAVKLVQDWLVRQAGLPRLEVTNEKDPGMAKFYDDKRVHVEKNTGDVIDDWDEIMQGLGFGGISKQDRK